jgi:hypothetical protein
MTCVDIGSQAPNLAWARDHPELVSFLHVKIVLKSCDGNGILVRSEASLLHLDHWGEGGKYLKVMRLHLKIRSSVN